MDSADASARQHADRELGDHGHVQHHAIALSHAEAAEHVRRLAHLAMQTLVSVDVHLFGGLALPDERGFVPARPVQVAIDAVARCVKLPAAEVAHERLIRIEIVFLDGVPRFEPVKVLGGHIGPKSLRIGDGTAVHGVVVLPAFDEGVVAEFGRGLDGRFVLEHLSDEGVAGVAVH